MILVLKSLKFMSLFWRENGCCMKTILAMAVNLENGVVRRGVGDPNQVMSGDEKSFSGDVWRPGDGSIDPNLLQNISDYIQM